jgi:chain length determinant protein
MNDNKEVAVIDLRLIFQKIREHKLLYFIVLPIAFVLSVFIILCVPRYYSTDTKLAPEVENGGSSGAIGSLASSLGFDMSQIKSSDAITPLLYPELMEDNKFIVDLFTIKIQTIDGKIYSYFDYLANRQKEPWWSTLIGKKEKSLKMDKISPYYLNKRQSKVVEAIRSNISLKVDSKDGVITIATTAQDPLTCKILADSVSSLLKQHITAYRTDKARKDVAYYKQLVGEAQASYERARQIYASYSDANQDVILQSVQSKIADLENDMQLKFNTYSNAKNQYDAARAKLQEKTPVFTVLKGASVPTKPAGPKRMIFVLVMEILTIIFLTIWVIRKDITKIFA